MIDQTKFKKIVSSCREPNTFTEVPYSSLMFKATDGNIVSINGASIYLNKQKNMIIYRGKATRESFESISKLGQTVQSGDSEITEAVDQIFEAASHVEDEQVQPDVEVVDDIYRHNLKLLSESQGAKFTQDQLLQALKDNDNDLVETLVKLSDS